MTKDQKESILITTKLLALAKDDESKFSTLKKYLHSKITEVMESKLQSNLRTLN
jgi:hypothetical protein